MEAVGPLNAKHLVGRCPPYAILQITLFRGKTCFITTVEGTFIRQRPPFTRTKAPVAFVHCFLKDPPRITTILSLKKKNSPQDQSVLLNFDLCHFLFFIVVQVYYTVCYEFLCLIRFCYGGEGSIPPPENKDPLVLGSTYGAHFPSEVSDVQSCCINMLHMRFVLSCLLEHCKACVLCSVMALYCLISFMPHPSTTLLYVRERRGSIIFSRSPPSWVMWTRQVNKMLAHQVWHCPSLVRACGYLQSLPNPMVGHLNFSPRLSPWLPEVKVKGCFYIY